MLLTRRRFLATGILPATLFLRGRPLPAQDAPRLPETITGISPEDAPAVRTLVAEFMRKYGVPGLSLAVARRGRLRITCGFGHTDREGDVELRPDHRFRIASASKPVTSVAVMQLVERGKLSLDHRVFAPRGLLRRFFDAQAERNAARRVRIEAITIQHLLEHTAGGWGNAERDPMFDPAALAFDHSRLIRWALRNRPLARDPGEEFEYSNFGYCLLGRVIEAATDQTYEEYVQAEVLKPASISRMQLGGRGRNERLPDEVVYYGQGEDPYGRSMNVRRMDAHGGWVATASDLVRLVVHVDVSPAPPDILAEETIRIMTTPSAANPRYAKGWSVNEFGNWWHLGAFNGAASVLVRTLDGDCWALLVNTRSPNEEFLSDLDRLPWDLRAAIHDWPDHDLFETP
jgi:CubicO group peptidase (beta-lactamase class C family)